MGRVALSEMSAASIPTASPPGRSRGGARRALLIPPSGGMIIYALLTIPVVIPIAIGQE